METMTVLKVAVTIMCMVAVLTLSAPLAVERPTCGEVSGALSSCLRYVKSGGNVSQRCCSAVKSLNDAATTPKLRELACDCVKFLFSIAPGVVSDLAAGLPGKCGVDVPFTFGPSADCSQVQWVQSS